MLDVGCGSGRWSRYLAPKVGFIEAMDPSEAVFVAQQVCKPFENIRITKAGVNHIPFPDRSFDLVFSLGVLHHIPDTAEGIKRAVAKLKPGGYFLVYLYYNFENRGGLFKALLKQTVCILLALLIYLPLVSISRFLKGMGSSIWSKIPLSYYHDKSLYVMKNDALDRFGTPLEQRFSKAEIRQMMEEAGLQNIVFSPRPPYWHAIGKKGN